MFASGRSPGAAGLSGLRRIALWASYGSPLIMVSSHGSASSGFRDARNLLSQLIVISSTTIDHWQAPSPTRALSCALGRSAVFPTCLIERLLDVIGKLSPAPRVIEGKRVLNLVPREARHKGEALRALIAHAAVDRALYIGDDITDENAFGVLAGADLLLIDGGAFPGTF